MDRRLGEEGRAMSGETMLPQGVEWDYGDNSLCITIQWETNRRLRGVLELENETEIFRDQISMETSYRKVARDDIHPRKMDNGGTPMICTASLEQRIRRTTVESRRSRALQSQPDWPEEACTPRKPTVQRSHETSSMQEQLVEDQLHQKKIEETTVDQLDGPSSMGVDSPVPNDVALPHGPRQEARAQHWEDISESEG
eukprot:c12173_g1_i1 orf=84-677(+)